MCSASSFEMIKKRCPKCGVTHPLSEEHKCRVVGKAKPSDDTGLSPVLVEVSPSVDKEGRAGTAVPVLAPGHPCPTCGKPYGLGAAERQRQYRERKK